MKQRVFIYLKKKVNGKKWVHQNLYYYKTFLQNVAIVQIKKLMKENISSKKK